MSPSKITGGLIVLAALGVLLGNNASKAEVVDSVRLHAVAVELPGSDRELPPGPGVELVTNNCTACHSPGMILTQPALNKAAWLGEVNKMRTTYKAPVPDEDVEPIASYLAALQVAR